MAKNANRIWTEEEIQYLSDNYGSKSYQTLARNLGRSVNAVNVMARRLGLGAFLQCGEYVTFNQLMLTLGYGQGNSYKMISWVKNRGFPMHSKRVNNNSFNVVYIDEFWEWAEKNQNLLDFSGFEENLLGMEPQWVKLKRKRDCENSRKYHTTPWTATEDRDLIRLVAQHRYTYDQLSRRMNRTCGAIQRRCVELGIKDRPVKADNHTFWTDEELARLGELIKQGFNYELIAERIGRSSKAVRGLVYRYYTTENLDKVRNFIGSGSFGDNCPEKKIKNFNVMDPEEKSRVRELVGRLVKILQSKI